MSSAFREADEPSASDVEVPKWFLFSSKHDIKHDIMQKLLAAIATTNQVFSLPRPIRKASSIQIQKGA
jgi:hypothetical protein